MQLQGGYEGSYRGDEMRLHLYWPGYCDGWKEEAAEGGRIEEEGE